MDSPYDHEPADKTHAEPRQPGEAEVRAVLEQSRRDIAEGRTVALAPVLDQMWATAERIRSRRGDKTGAGRRPA
jgi:hypothetical protein